MSSSRATPAEEHHWPDPPVQELPALPHQVQQGLHPPEDAGQDQRLPQGAEQGQAGGEEQGEEDLQRQDFCGRKIICHELRIVHPIGIWAKCCDFFLYDINFLCLSFYISKHYFVHFGTIVIFKSIIFIYSLKLSVYVLLHNMY